MEQRTSRQNYERRERIRRRKQRQKRKLMILGVSLLVLMIILLVTGIKYGKQMRAERDAKKALDTQTEQSTQDTVLKYDTDSEEIKDTQEQAADEENKPQESEEKQEAANGAESEAGDQQENVTTGATSTALETSWIGTDGLDTTILDWGQGLNFDSLNRPGGCLSYQDKYGKYGAYFIGPTEEKVIYLTMDEGYEYGVSGQILDTLKEKQVPCVFFLTKPYAESEPELVQRMIAEGHELGNHSVTHPATGIPSLDLDSQYYEVQETHRYVKETFGYDMHLFRYPAGKFSEQSLAVINNCGYRSVFWSFAYRDYDVNNQPDPAESLQKIVERLHPGAIYLLHAESTTNASILGSFIDQARAMGYRFELLQ